MTAHSSDQREPSSGPPSGATLAVYSIVILLSFLLVGGLVWMLYLRTRPGSPNQARISERVQGLREIRSTSAEAFQNYGWQNQAVGVIRLPITNAMELVVREWQNPALGRSNLLARLERANPPPPPAAAPAPPPAAEPNPYE
jgi:hypothetical protein